MAFNDFNISIRIFFLLFFNIVLAQVETIDTSVSKNDTVTIIQPIVKTDVDAANDTVKKERLQGILDYDSYDQYHDYKNQHTYLVTDAIVKYLDMEIQADYIDINWNTGDIYAVGKEDSLGNIVEPSKFRQGNKEIEYNSFSFNINTKRGKAFNVRTEESMGSDQGVIIAGVVKQYNDSVSGMRKVAYTTDTYFIQRKDSIADYHMEAEIAKYMQGKDKKVVTGPIVMKIYEVTTPLALPFAFLPMGDNRSAGILLPSFGEREEVGFYLQGAGFYLPIGDYMDISLTGDVYTRGSLGLHAMSQYLKRYSFSGNFSFDWEKRVTGIKGLDDYNKSTNYRLAWSHRQDPKANPNLIFSANVNFMSSKFYREGISNYGISSGNYLQNNVNSSISINKNFPNSPFSASLTVSHSQNTNNNSDQQGNATFQLPQLTVNMSNIYPFAPKTGSKKGLWQSIGMNYNFNLQNTLYTTEDDLFSSRMFDNAKNGARHNFSFNTGTTIFKYFPLSFNAGYEEVWTLHTIRKQYDDLTNSVFEERVNGFDSYRTFNLGTGISTTLYGQANFGTADDDKMIKAIRHMISPRVSFNYRPDFSTDEWGYYDAFINGEGEEIRYSYFDGGIYGAPSQGLSQSLSIGINNNLEMKIRSKSDSTGIEKIKIFESFNISTGYNFAADSLKLSPISINGRTSLFKNKMGISFRATVDPYKNLVNDEFPNGKRIDELGKFRFTTMGVRLNYNLTEALFGEREMDYEKRGRIRYEDYYFDDDNYAQFLTPWSLAVDLTHTRTMSLTDEVRNTTSVGLRGSISPTPHWAFSGRTSLDVQKMDFAGTYFTFSRDLRSFVIDFSMNPFGQYKTWNFFIGIKANFLRDAVKYEEREFNSRTNTF
ncbi:putative LPS assembly protein LptD [Weeksellaceae bacterium KMM 9724]|uniref:putative LPS assembly protein LptD n=1 Tax=Profundicola chukchiensis TaxID=2961959 RepID=UPI0024394237|nr:putative LPS assembly protein LptD [Profundicola chukchiensis]MDG4951036.1 putative LPS assembly protein LptD [Profundicola chukchiensis]